MAPPGDVRGHPDTPHNNRWWEIVQKYGVSLLYTAPTAIRTFMKWGNDIPAQFDLSSPAPAGQRGRADQPRGLDLVPRPHRRRRRAHRGHLVADGDRRDDDQPVAGGDRVQTGLRDAPTAGDQRRRGRRHGRTGGARRWWLPGAEQAVAGDAARDLGRRPARTRTPTGCDGAVLLRRDGAKYDQDGAIWLWAASTTS